MNSRTRKPTYPPPTKNVHAFSFFLDLHIWFLLRGYFILISVFLSIQLDKEAICLKTFVFLSYKNGKGI